MLLLMMLIVSTSGFLNRVFYLLWRVFTSIHLRLIFRFVLVFCWFVDCRCCCCCCFYPSLSLSLSQCVFVCLLFLFYAFACLFIFSAVPPSPLPSLLLLWFHSIPLAIPNLHQPIHRTFDCVRQRIFVILISPVDQHMDVYGLLFHVNIYRPYHFVSNRNL